jgi:hypothetical protein
VPAISPPAQPQRSEQVHRSCLNSFVLKGVGVQGVRGVGRARLPERPRIPSEERACITERRASLRTRRAVVRAELRLGTSLGLATFRG